MQYGVSRYWMKTKSFNLSDLKIFIFQHSVIRLCIVAEGSRTAFFRECMDSRLWGGGAGFCRGNLHWFHVLLCKLKNCIDNILLAAKCPHLVLFDHQIVTVNSPSSCLTQPVEGDICAVECDAGYILEGGGSVIQLTCDVSGRWSRQMLQCRREFLLVESMCVFIILARWESVYDMLVLQNLAWTIFLVLLCTTITRQLIKLEKSSNSPNKWEVFLFGLNFFLEGLDFVFLWVTS